MKNIFKVLSFLTVLSILLYEEYSDSLYLLISKSIVLKKYSRDFISNIEKFTISLNVKMFLLDEVKKLI